MIKIKVRPAAVRPAEAENERNSRARPAEAIAEFFKASAPSHAPYPRPAGNADMDYFGLKLVVHILIRGSLGKGELNQAMQPGSFILPVN